MPGVVFGVVHASVGHGPGRLPDDEPGFFRAGAPASGPVAQISCGRYIPAHWQEAITYRPLPALQVSCRNGIAFVDLPATLVWFDEAGRHQESLESERPVGEQLLGQFHRAVTSLVRKTNDLEDAYRACRLFRKPAAAIARAGEWNCREGGRRRAEGGR